MGTTQTELFPPPTRDKVVDDKGFLGRSFRQWFFTLQNLFPLVIVDTSGGNISDAAPNAGNDASTGQSNQNMEITYLKGSPDAHTFTLTGVEGGPFMLHSQFDVIRIKSDGTNWWPVG